MKIFLSWSGNRSKAVAELLRQWIRCVLQATRPWVSTRDLDRGSVWFSEINDQLKDTTIGIICLSQQNKERPWILFEAGALVKGLSSSRLYTLLIDLQPTDIRDPLAQFNHTRPEKEEMLGLIENINAQLGANALDQITLKTVFETYWPQFELKFRQVLETIEAGVEVQPRDSQDMMVEVLNLTRSLSHRLSSLESGQREQLRRVKGDDLVDLSKASDWAKSRATKLAAEGMSRDEIVDALRRGGISTPFAQSLVYALSDNCFRQKTIFEINIDHNNATN